MLEAQLPALASARPAGLLKTRSIPDQTDREFSLSPSAQGLHFTLMVPSRTSSSPCESTSDALAQPSPLPPTRPERAKVAFASDHSRGATSVRYFRVSRPAT